MPRFQFRIHDRSTILYTETATLTDLAQARLRALRKNAEFIRTMRPGHEWKIDVVDDAGDTVYGVGTFSLMTRAPSH